MKKTNKTITALLIIFTFLVTIFTYNTTAIQISQKNNTITVDKHGNGDYTTIKEAITNSPEGSTIYIKNGEYPEILEIKKLIYLIGEGKDAAIINPISQKNKYAVNLGAPGIKISSLSITNGAPGLYTSAIRITACDTEIKNCNIYNTPVGISIWSSNNKIDNCNFYNCKDEGIALLGSDYYECNSNTITNCEFYENGDGIELKQSSYNTISNCEFYKNTHAGIDAISSNNKNTITNCKIYNNKQYGIYLSSSSENQIIDCEIKNNKYGDLVENGESKNNDIITKYDLLENPSKQKTTISIIQNLLSKIYKIKNSKILTLLGLDNF